MRSTCLRFALVVALCSACSGKTEPAPARPAPTPSAVAPPASDSPTTAATPTEDAKAATEAKAAETKATPVVKPAPEAKPVAKPSAPAKQPVTAPVPPKAPETTASPAPAPAPTVPATAPAAAAATTAHAAVGAAKCKMCHRVQFESWSASQHAAKGLDCEGCHGNGADYMKPSVMRDRAAAVAAGLVVQDVAACRKCHPGADASLLPKAHAHKAK